MQRVLPQLCAEFSNLQLIPFVLPNVLLIAEDCTTQEFIDFILPELKPVFKIEDPVQVVIILLQKMDILLAKTPKDDVRDHVLPMVCKALESPSEQLQVPYLVLMSVNLFVTMTPNSALRVQACCGCICFFVRSTCLQCRG